MSSSKVPLCTFSSFVSILHVSDTLLLSALIGSIPGTGAAGAAVRAERVAGQEGEPAAGGGGQTRGGLLEKGHMLGNTTKASLCKMFRDYMSLQVAFV